MYWAKILVAVLSSVWFFPVSCTAGLYVGTRVTAELDARDATKGEPVHSHFSIVSESRGSGEPFVVTKLNDLRHREKLLPLSSTDSTSYLMSSPSGFKSADTADYSYKVLEETTSEQIIEVVETYHDGDNTIWSRYKANQFEITPISSRMFYFGYMFAAFPYALGLSLLLFGIGRYFKHRVSEWNLGNGDT